MTVETRARRIPTQERSRRTVEKILDAAERIAGEEGADAATTRAIAERAGVAVPSLYRFFADRDEILDAVLERMVLDLDAHAQAAEAKWAPGDVEDLIRLQLGLHVDYFEAHPGLVALWFGGRASPPVTEAIRERNRRLARRLRALLVAGRLVRSDAPDAVFDLLVEYGDRTLEIMFRDRQRPDREALDLGVAALTAVIERYAAGSPSGVT